MERKRVRFALVLAVGLTGCSGSIEFGRPPIVVSPAVGRTVVEPNGTIVEEPSVTPIETVITGLSQAQAVRTLTRQLAR
jgi:PBP1b-binding outer membrane lipoprotein LpoB